MADHAPEEKAENYKELKKYDSAHSWDDPDFLKNRPKIILKKKRPPSRKPPFPMRVLKTMRRVFKSIKNFKREGALLAL